MFFQCFNQIENIGFVQRYYIAQRHLHDFFFNLIRSPFLILRPFLT